MKISAVQFLPKLKDKENNIKKVIEFANTVESDLIVFPELCTTGYFLTDSELKSLAESFDGNTVKNVQEISSSLNKIIVFGFAEIYKDKYYNSAAIIFPDSKFSTVYRKTHLFYKEKLIFQKGNTGFFNIYYPEFDLNLGTMICYDWRFPEAARTLALAGSDLIVVPSNLVTKIWHRSMPARAMDNHVFLVVANRIGSENPENEELLFTGRSVIYDYNGKELCLADSDNETVLTIDINHKESRNKAINAYNNLFEDRLTEFYYLK